jgi:hypothetical protein
VNDRPQITKSGSHLSLLVDGPNNSLSNAILANCPVAEANSVVDVLLLVIGGCFFVSPLWLFATPPFVHLRILQIWRRGFCNLFALPKSQPVNVGHGHKEGNCPELAIPSILLGTGPGWANAAGQIEDGAKTAICRLK